MNNYGVPKMTRGKGVRDLPIQKENSLLGDDSDNEFGDIPLKNEDGSELGRTIGKGSGNSIALTK